MTELTATFRDALERGELLLQSCNACDGVIMYPRHRCPFCQSADLGWLTAAGGGVLHSYTVVRAVPPKGFEDDVPYALGVVKLDEGAQLLVRLQPGDDGTWDAYACDARVAFSPAGAEEIRRRPAPWFALATGAQDR
jgi:uncharacterized OB-fold protein